MKKILKPFNGMFKFICVVVLCAGIAVLVSTCGDDEDDCMTCTNPQSDPPTKVFCGDDLVEVKKLPHVICK